MRLIFIQTPKKTGFSPPPAVLYFALESVTKEEEAMTIHLPEELEHFVQTEVSKGHFASADEAISQAVQLLRQRAQQLTEDEWEQRPGAIRPSGPYSAPPLRRAVPV